MSPLSAGDDGLVTTEATLDTVTFLTSSPDAVRRPKLGPFDVRSLMAMVLLDPSVIQLMVMQRCEPPNMPRAVKVFDSVLLVLLPIESPMLKARLL